MKSSNNLAKQTRLLNFYKLNRISFFLLIALLSVVFGVALQFPIIQSLYDTDLDMAAEIMGSSIADQQSGLLTVYMTPYLISPKLVLVMEMTKHFHQKGIKRPVDVVLKNHSVILMTVPMVFILFLLSVVLKRMFSSSISTLQKIKYTDLEGNFIARPKLHRNAINQVYLHSTKSGMNSNPRKSSEFTKIDSLNFLGVHATQNLLQMHGSSRSWQWHSRIKR